MWHLDAYLKASIVMMVNTNPIIERVTPIIEMTSRAIAFDLLNPQSSSSVLEQISCIRVTVRVFMIISAFSMLLTTRAAKLVKCEQLHTTSKVPREKRVSHPWFIQSEDPYARTFGI